MCQNKGILIFIDYFFPGYKAGGILRSVYNLVNSIKEYDFYIVTRDRDLGYDISYSNVPKNKWVKNSNIHTIYLSKTHETIHVFKKIIEEINPQYVLLNCIYSIKYCIIPLLITKFLNKKVKIILSTHGMLNKEALNFKRFKKIVYLHFIKFFLILNGVNWHVTCDQEKTEVQNVLGKSIKIISLPYLVHFKNINYLNRNKTVDQVHLCFFSRICKKKNLLWAINLLRNIKTAVNLSIIGPAEDEKYFQKCMKAKEKLPANIKIDYLGDVPFDKVIDKLQKYHFLYLPTLNENFGHVIIEALLAGCPVILSKNTPFNNLSKINVGWDISLNDTNQWINVIERCGRMSQKEYNMMSIAAFQYANTYINDNNTIDQYRKLFTMQ